MSGQRRRYLVCYDIADPSRLRRVAVVCESWGTRVQESVFDCALDGVGYEKLITRLSEIIHRSEDRVLLVDVGPDGAATAAALRTLGLPLAVRTSVTVI